MFKPASFAWLFAHELKLLWRNSILLRTSQHVLIPVILVAVLFQATALGIADILRGQSLSLPVLILIANVNLIFLGGLMLSRSLSLAVDVLYSRGDADFLLASPIPPSRILAVRMLGVAASTGAPWLLLTGVMANALAVFGHPAALTGYLAVGLSAILAATAAFFLVVFITARLPPATARRISQSLALLMGLIIFAAGQMPRFLPHQTVKNIYLTFLPTPTNITQPIWLPARAALGQPLPLTGAIIITIAFFMIVLSIRAKSFATGMISAAALSHRIPASTGTGQFRDNPFAAATLKDLRLIIRFPGLVTQTIYRSLTLVPALIILSGRTSVHGSPAIAIPLLVFLTGQLALFFVSIIIGGEQAPDLLASSPAGMSTGKQAAYAAAGYATFIVMAIPIFGVLLSQPGRLFALLAGMAGVAASNLILGEKYPIPLYRADFGKTRIGTIFGLIIGVAISSIWGLATWLLVAPNPWAPLG
jgi:ABC-2 type transport system permease protein